MTMHLTRYRFTVDDYHCMDAAGIIPPDARVELIDGEVVQLPPIGPGHASRVGRLTQLVSRTFGDVALVWVQDPLHLGPYDEPEPDLMLLRPRADFYAGAHPTPADVFLVVEIGDTSAAPDLRLKLPRYARDGVPELWLEDLEAETITVCRDLAPDGYRTMQTLRCGDRVALLAFPDRAMAVADILGGP